MGVWPLRPQCNSGFLQPDCSADICRWISAPICKKIVWAAPPMDRKLYYIFCSIYFIHFVLCRCVWAVVLFRLMLISTWLNGAMVKAYMGVESGGGGGTRVARSKRVRRERPLRLENSRLPGHTADDSSPRSRIRGNAPEGTFSREFWPLWGIELWWWSIYPGGSGTTVKPHTICLTSGPNWGRCLMHRLCKKHLSVWDLRVECHRECHRVDIVL